AKCDRDRMRFQRAWRKIDDEPLGFAGAASLQLVGHDLDVPIWGEVGAGIHFGEAALDEVSKIVPQERSVLCDAEFHVFKSPGTPFRNGRESGSGFSGPQPSGQSWGSTRTPPAADKSEAARRGGAVRRSLRWLPC